MKGVLDFSIQANLACFGIAGIVMSYHPDPNIKQWSPVVGLASQPFWLSMAVRNRLWGVFITSVAYTGAWGFGVYRMFFT